MLSGKLCLVTGATGGIGKAICERFVGLGATVVAADLNKKAVAAVVDSLPKNESNSACSSIGHYGVQCDVSNADFVKQMHAIIVKHYGDIAPSVVVNAAGITMDARLHRMTEEQWDWVINVNLKGTFLINQTFSQSMPDGGSLVNISSIVGRTGNFGQANYAASKAGVIGLTKTVARELAAQRIRANVVVPGFIRTAMTDKIPEQIREGIQGLIPMGRMGRPEDVADACAYLASDMSLYVTGAVLDVTGGMGM